MRRREDPSQGQGCGALCDRVPEVNPGLEEKVERLAAELQQLRKDLEVERAARATLERLVAALGGPLRPGGGGGEQNGAGQATRQPLELPEEVGTERASEILGVSKDTLVGYLKEGRLPYRDIALRSSSRPVFRIPLAAVLEMRTGHEVAEPPTAPLPREPVRRRAKAAREKYKHLDAGDD
jgi:hypothetical protein